MATKSVPKRSVKSVSYPLDFVLCPYHTVSFPLHFLLHHLLLEVTGCRVEQGIRWKILAQEVSPLWGLKLSSLNAVAHVHSGSLIQLQTKKKF